MNTLINFLLVQNSSMMGGDIGGSGGCEEELNNQEEAEFQVLKEIELQN